jgi:RNA polymerase sigma factor (sigma-70 family)
MSVTQAQFDSLLSWLNPDRDLAGRKYQTIHSGLVRIFVSKGFNNAEDLADETINRVIERLPDIQDSFVGEPAYYFHGVARNIIRETSRRKEIPCNVFDTWAALRSDERDEHDYDCLGRCLQSLPKGKRDLILDYYLYEGHDKVEHHRNMAKQLNITDGAFRSRAYQIRLNLRSCMRQCALRGKRHLCAWIKSGIVHS